MRNKEITLTLKDLIKLGVIKLKKKRKSKNKRSKQKINHKDGYLMGGSKSDSSHMQGYSQSMPFSGTSNTGTEIQHLQRQMLENQIKNPDRFIKNEPNNNLTIDQYKSSISPVLERIMNLENIGNQLMSDVGYDPSDFIKVKGNPRKIEDDIDETNYYDINDNNGIISSNEPDNYFPKEGNVNPYQEIEPYHHNTSGTPSNEEEFNTPQLQKSIYSINDNLKNQIGNLNDYYNVFEQPEPDVIIPENFKELFIPKEPEKKEEFFNTPQKEKTNEENTPKSEPSKSPIKQKYYTIEATDKLPNDYVKAKDRYKKLVLQFGQSNEEIDDYFKGKTIPQIREEYKKYYNKAMVHNLKKSQKKKSTVI